MKDTIYNVLDGRGLAIMRVTKAEYKQLKKRLGEDAKFWSHQKELPKTVPIASWVKEISAEIHVSIESQILATLADLFGITPRNVASKKALLLNGGLEKEDCTERVIEQAARILGAFSVKIQEKEKEMNKRVDEQAERWDDGFSETKPNSGRSAKLFGHPATAVIRWMGLDAWSFDEAKRALQALSVDVADGTIRAQLSAGKYGHRGDPAVLTVAQEMMLYEESKE